MRWSGVDKLCPGPFYLPYRFAPVKDNIPRLPVDTYLWIILVESLRDIWWKKNAIHAENKFLVPNKEEKNLRAS